MTDRTGHQVTLFPFWGERLQASFILRGQNMPGIGLLPCGFQVFKSPHLRQLGLYAHGATNYKEGDCTRQSPLDISISFMPIKRLQPVDS
jgi:hypothetical protein